MPVPILQQIPVFAKAPFAIYRLMDRDTLKSPILGGFSIFITWNGWFGAIMRFRRCPRRRSISPLGGIADSPQLVEVQPLFARLSLQVPRHTVWASLPKNEE
jgi:hypothetical protein